MHCYESEIKNYLYTKKRKTEIVIFAFRKEERYEIYKYICISL